MAVYGNRLIVEVTRHVIQHRDEDNDMDLSSLSRTLRLEFLANHIRRSFLLRLRKCVHRSSYTLRIYSCVLAVSHTQQFFKVYRSQ